MAVVSPVVAQHAGGIRYPNIMEEPSVEDTVFVAVGKDVKESKSALIWAIHNSNGNKICLLYVHVPAQMIPMMGTKFHVSSMEDQEVTAFREIERQTMHKLLNDYLSLCRHTGIQVEKVHIETDSIEKGIVELISQLNIRRLVMGAAADKYYSRKMVELRSKKAIHVRQQAPGFCHIHFTCKGHLIHTRANDLNGADVEVRSLSVLQNPRTDRGQLRSLSVNLGTNSHATNTGMAQDLLRRARSANTDKFTDEGSPRNMIDNGADYDAWVAYRRGTRSASIASGFSTCSSTPTADLALVPYMSNVRRETSSDVTSFSNSKDDFTHSSPPSVLDGSVDDFLYDHVEHAFAEAETAKREAFDEAIRRGKAEKDAIDAIRWAKASEFLYREELKRRKEMEDALTVETEELDRMKRQQDEVAEELRAAQSEASMLETQITEADESLKDLEHKFFSAVELLQNYKKEREELQLERDNALTEAEELRKEHGNSHVPRFFSEFSFSEVEEATSGFEPSLKVGEGGYGSIYKGLLRHTQVAIKMLNPHSMQGPKEFQQEVDILSKLRHPNLVTLIGACPEAWGLVYEYLPNGSLEDRLSCKDNTSPLTWQSRIRIASELCSVLMFLHSSKPHSIVHGDLKPANVLLDSNFVSKLSDFGISRLLSSDEYCRTDPKGTFAYMDPEFLSTGELTSKSDVYSFGIIVLRLLTGKAAVGITKEVQCALEQGKLMKILDSVAGDWPFVQAQQLARLALRCCEMSRKDRPDLASDVWRVLEPMRASSGGSSSFRLASGEHFQPPPYFICPIFQEVMQDPQVAADGFTYEAEAVRGWLDSGHDTSPMTSLKLDHRDLVPNHALRSAIQEWLQHR